MYIYANLPKASETIFKKNLLHLKEVAVVIAQVLFFGYTLNLL